MCPNTTYRAQYSSWMLKTETAGIYTYISHLPDFGPCVKRTSGIEVDKDRVEQMKHNLPNFFHLRCFQQKWEHFSHWFRFPVLSIRGINQRFPWPLLPQPTNRDGLTRDRHSVGFFIPLRQITRWSPIFFSHPPQGSTKKCETATATRASSIHDQAIINSFAI